MIDYIHLLKWILSTKLVDQENQLNLVVTEQNDLLQAITKQHYFSNHLFQLRECTAQSVQIVFVQSVLAKCATLQNSEKQQMYTVFTTSDNTCVKIAPLSPMKPFKSPTTTPLSDGKFRMLHPPTDILISKEFPKLEGLGVMTENKNVSSTF